MISSVVLNADIQQTSAICMATQKRNRGSPGDTEGLHVKLHSSRHMRRVGRYYKRACIVKANLESLVTELTNPCKL